MASNVDNLVIKPNGNVLLIDPNLVNTNPDITNSIPQYQDMFIFVELVAKARGRTVIEVKSNLYSLQPESSSQNDIAVNFIGNNQDDKNNNPNYLNFTTNWYDGSTGNNQQTEGFGINNIKIVINSSFVPQINVQFIDLRGLAFFNQNDSIYRILFDFPPPIFYLTIKGYYGKPLTYMMHLVKYTSEFRAENGNFVIDAQFIAMTYAPLTDVLFTYVVNFPLITNKISVNPNPGQPPANTNELILKVKALYSPSNDKDKTTVDTKAYNDVLAKIKSLNDLFIYLDSYNDNPILNKDTPILMYSTSSTVDNGVDGTQTTVQLTKINTYSDYDSEITDVIVPNNGIIQSYGNRLYFGYLVTNDTPPWSFLNTPVTPAPATENPATTFVDSLIPKQTKLTNTLTAYKNKLIGDALTIQPLIVTSDDIISPTPLYNYLNVITNTTTNSKNTYVCIDVTNYYTKLYKYRTKLLKDKTDTANTLKESINNMVINKLGMIPSIYNVFKIILDDVDTFFNILRTTSYTAESDHHPRNIQKILSGNFQDPQNFANPKSTKIYAFPLFIKDEPMCGGMKQTRIAPIELSNSLGNDPFPEIVLVQNFINSFITQRNYAANYNMKSEQNADGTNKWIPISPIDSKLGTDNVSSPYISVDNANGVQVVVNTVNPPPLNNALAIILKRFYVLSQFSLPYKFYGNNINQDKRFVNDANDFIKLYAESEALNLSTSLYNKNVINNLFSAVSQFNNNSTAFYNYLQNQTTGNLKDIYSFADNTIPIMNLTDNDTLDTTYTPYPYDVGTPYVFTDNIFVNKTNDSFKGLKVTNISVVTQTSDATTPINTFVTSTEGHFWKAKTVESVFGFSQENVLYINESKTDGAVNGTNIYTRFLCGNNPDGLEVEGDKVYNPINLDIYASKTRIIDDVNVAKSGNLDILLEVYPSSKYGPSYYEVFNNVINLWATMLSQHDIELYPTIIDYTGDSYNSLLSAIMLVSNFGYTLSPFNEYPFNLNSKLFSVPAIVEVPSYLPYYMGSLVDVQRKDSTYNLIYDYFVNGSGKTLNSGGILIFADIVDINNQLAYFDKQDLKRQFYEDFYGARYDKPTNTYIEGGGENSTFNGIIRALYDLYTNHIANDATLNTKNTALNISKKNEAYTKYLTGDYFSSIMYPLLKRVNLLNFSQITFQRNAPTISDYYSLASTNKDKTKSTYNNTYFDTFFAKLYTQLKTKLADANKQEEQDKKLSNDIDIITQTYYSFKNINDKWVVQPKNNLAKSGNLGYPFNEINPTDTAGHLIDLFAFVDRAMNPIGDTIINPEMLTNLLDDQNATVFTVLSNLLSQNGFEFFPLQNFMKFDDKNGAKWMESFKINTSGTVSQSPAFVCMYIGGSSSYPTGINVGSQFKNDGIVDIGDPNDAGKDFSSKPCPANSNDSDKQTEGNTNFPYKQVRAFRVRFGEQNQSMFTNIKIDSKEYPETNESIQIMSRLAGDNKSQAPVPKGQNLYNLYENRSYRATVQGLGNAMIQPTQYFQIENVPLYNGAYIILSVEHDIEPNKMTTTFSGTKILKFPIPRVLSPSSILGFQGGNTDETDGNASSASTVTPGPNGNTDLTKAQFNSMYQFKIQ